MRKTVTRFIFRGPVPWLCVMATLKDLSKHLGLSVTQVSRAINDHADVSQKTKERVRAAAKELGYAVNQSARSLVTGKSGMVTLIRPGGLAGPADEPVLETLSGLSDEFHKRGMQFVLNIMPAGTDPMPTHRKAASSGSFDGFVLIAPRVDDPRVQLLTEMGVPFVVHGRIAQDAAHSYYDIDNYKVGYEHTKRLLALGHRRIALLNAVRGYSFSEFRLRGYKDALAEADVTYDPALLVSEPMTEGNGMIATARLFADAENHPTALICGNIRLAKGAYTALGAMNLRIPEDVSVVAHDDVLHNIRGSAFFPALTVTKSPFADSWSHLAEILCETIKDPQTPNRQVVVDAEFIERASTGPAPR